MGISYDKTPPPVDFRKYDDEEISRMAAYAREGSREYAMWGEIQRLRRVVARLVKNANPKGR